MKRIFFLPIILLTACISFGKQTEEQARIIHADVVALNQNIIYNRFGSHNPYGMIYALKSDVVSTDGSANLAPGKVRLRSDKRPRPLVLRVNEGDILEVNFTNLLNPSINPAGTDTKAGAEPHAAVDPDKVREFDQGNPCVPINGVENGKPVANDLNSPRSRCASMAVSGLPTVEEGTPGNNGTHGNPPVPPGQTVTYRWKAGKVGTFLFSSLSAPSGGQGDGGSLVLGLFGAVNVEPKGSDWYRSAVKESDMKLVRDQAIAPALLNYEAKYQDGKPVLNMLQKIDDNHYQLIYSLLDAVIVVKNSLRAHREFSVVFHDELKTVYQKEFAILSPEQAGKALEPYSNQLAGIRDGFAINYGASGLGTMLLANRLKMGPARNCVDCMYEEFFLQSWANGDPALLAEYEDDPSNVHHSYLNDPVQFQNSHVGPKETHVFHLHAHQWNSSTSGKANYLDSQTIAPQQSFSYRIDYGGSGNRNQTPGDSIFHCHLYPHFAQGMWGLWRVHDVLEDGSRKLPDGGNLPWEKVATEGEGTNPLTGMATGGTPIPAIVPLPYRAMPVKPTYGENGFPGFPFYMAAKAGHRAPQPPLDIVRDGGLGRHVVLQGERTFAAGPDPVNQLKEADLTAKVTQAKIMLLPAEGTKLEQNAMAFHAKADNYFSQTPEGESELFKVNGMPPQPGAPFADPCGKDNQGSNKSVPTRRYRASVIDLDIQTNEHEWHDPQSRINVLDTEVKHYEHKRMVKDAEPFFFRAESGECVEFIHTNRAHKDLFRDDFQVATPTDIIGQHIHLVKFDVMASDGSANGFNYQDGTLAWDAIKELSEASRIPDGSVVDEFEQPSDKVIKAEIDPKTKEPVYQQTIQRWWVDERLHADGYDAGLGTVFTHDHFAPSSIQQHGFYNALLVEPKGTQWLTPSGDDLKKTDIPCKDVSMSNIMKKHVQPDCSESFAVGSRAQVLATPASQHHTDTREFAMAVADFGILYDKKVNDPLSTMLTDSMRASTVEEYRQIRNDCPPAIDACDGKDMNHCGRELKKCGWGSPVDPPARPESISVDHHNPYLFNYKHEPIPLRIGERSSIDHHFKLKSGELCPENHVSEVNALKPDALCHPEDAVYAFSSKAPHGDPFLPPFRGYEGDKVLIRLIQGAQEVQHNFSIHGVNWHREARNLNAPWISSQEIGISEHFEISLPSLGNIDRGLPTADYLFHAGSQDALWNGAWGLIRAFADTSTIDPAVCEDKSNGSNYGVLQTSEIKLAEAEEGDAICGKASIKSIGTKMPAGECSIQQDRMDGCSLAPLNSNPEGRIKISKSSSNFDKYCSNPKTTEIEAWSVKDLIGSNLVYDNKASIIDPNALVYLESSKVNDVKSGKVKKLEPFVLRVNAGDCLEIKLTNHLKTADDAPGDAPMPKIVSFNVGADKADPERVNDASKDSVKPSLKVGLHPGLLGYTIYTEDGMMVGHNASPTINAGLAAPGETKTYRWYAGTIEPAETASGTSYQYIPFSQPYVALLQPADLIGQTIHGLFGAIVVYPKGYSFSPDPTTNLSADVRYKNGLEDRHYREFVVFYQDGLNLHQNDLPIPDCFICDDSYDFGEKAVNYRSPAFWSRLGLLNKAQHTKGYNLNAISFAPDFFETGFEAQTGADAPPTFTARSGDEVHFLLLHPGGRARQHSFQVYGHSFKPYITGYGALWSILMGPGKTETAVIEKAKEGTWLFRDGPAQLFAGGVWGRLQVN
jgi:hypothetical protein